MFSEIVENSPTNKLTTDQPSALCLCCHQIVSQRPTTNTTNLCGLNIVHTDFLRKSTHTMWNVELWMYSTASWSKINSNNWRCGQSNIHLHSICYALSARPNSESWQNNVNWVLCVHTVHTSRTFSIQLLFVLCSVLRVCAQTKLNIFLWRNVLCTMTHRERRRERDADSIQFCHYLRYDQMKMA